MNLRFYFVALVAAMVILTSVGVATAAEPPRKGPAALPPEMGTPILTPASDPAESQAEMKNLVNEPPPLRAPDVVISRAETTATVSKTMVEYKMALEVSSRSDENRVLLTLPATIAVTNVEVKKGSRDGVQLVRRREGYTLYALRKGDYEVRIDFAGAVVGGENDLKKQIVTPMPQATTAILTVVLPGTSLDVSVSPEVPIKTEEGKQSTTITVYGGQAEALTMRWSPKAPEKELEAKVFAEETTMVRLGMGVLRLESQVNYAIIQGKVSTFRLALPEQGTLLKVEGANLRSWDIEAADGKRVLKVELLGPVSDKYSLALALEQALETPAADKPLALEIPVLEVLGVSRETGSVAISADKGFKVETGQIEGASQIDIRDRPEMPMMVAHRPGEEVQLGFKYVKRPVKIAAKLSLVEAQVSAEVFTMARFAPESIRLTSTIKYQIRDSGVFHFRIKLDKDVRLIAPQGKDINNWALGADQILTVDLRAKAEDEYTLVLVTEKQIQGADIEVPRIELLGVQRERGFVAMDASPGIKIDPQTTDGITQINLKDLPQDNKEFQTATLAYRYIRHPYKLVVTMAEVQPEIVATTQSLIDVDESEVKVSFDVSYDIRKAGVFSLKLGIPQGLQVLDLVGAQVDDWKLNKETNILEVTLAAKKEGVYSLHLVGEQRLMPEPGKGNQIKTVQTVSNVQSGKALSLPNITCQDVRRETGFVAVRPADGLRVRSADGGLQNVSEVDVKELPAQLQQAGVALGYKYFLQPWQASLRLEKIEPYVTAEIFNFISLGEAYLQAGATIQYMIQYAGTQTFRFRLPQGTDADSVDITAPDIKSKEKDPRDPNVWTVTFQAKHKGNMYLNISFRIKVDKDIKQLPYQGVEALDVTQERGFVAVAPRTDLEVSATQETQGMIPIDDREIPGNYTRGISGAVALAFRYPSRPYELHLNMIHRQLADVLVAVIESCKLKSTVTDDGNVMTDVFYRMRNIREQYLELRLPADAQIWHAYVDGERVVPVTASAAGDPGEGQVIMISIIGHGKDQRPFDIRLSYSSRIGSLGNIGKLALQVPGAKVAAMRVAWDLVLPKDYVLVSSSGSLNLVDQMDGDLAAISMLPPLAARILSGSEQPAPAAEKLQYELQVEQNKRVMGNALNVNAQPMATPTDDVTNFGDRRAPAPVYAGQPEIEKHQQHYYFQSLLAMGGSTPQLKVSYMRGPWLAVLRGLVMVLAAIVVLVFWWRSSAQVAWKVVGILSLAALVLAIRTLAGHSYQDFLTDIIWVLVAAAVLLGLVHSVVSLSRKIDVWRQDRPAEAAPATAVGQRPPVQPVLRPASTDDGGMPPPGMEAGPPQSGTKTQGR